MMHLKPLPKNSLAAGATADRRAGIQPTGSRFELPGNAAIIRKEGTRLVIEPVARTSLLAVLDSLEPLDEDFPRIEDLPPEDVTL